MVYVVSVEHLFRSQQRDVDRHVPVMSRELDDTAGERVQGLLPVQHWFHSRRRGLCRVPAGDVQPAAGTDGVLKLHGRYVLAEFRSSKQRDVRDL